MNPAVIGTDVVERQVVNGVLHTHRLVSSTWYFPRWAQSVCNLHFNYILFIYESKDLQTQKLRFVKFKIF